MTELVTFIPSYTAVLVHSFMTHPTHAYLPGSLAARHHCTGVLFFSRSEISDLFLLVLLETGMADKLIYCVHMHITCLMLHVYNCDADVRLLM